MVFFVRGASDIFGPLSLTSSESFGFNTAENSTNSFAQIWDFSFSCIASSTETLDHSWYDFSPGTREPFNKGIFSPLSNLLLSLGGTGMIASSSTFRPHPGRVIRDLFRLLDAVTALYGSTSLQQSSKGSCSLLVSGYNLRADCQWRTLVPPLNSGANAAPASVLALM